MSVLRFAIAGTGFWARIQLAAWRELCGVECVALYNRTRSKAEALGREFAICAIYDDLAEMLEKVRPDFLDIISDVTTHGRFVRLAAQFEIPVICQKPMAASLAEANQMVRACKEAGVPLFIHENWRWQTPIRQLKKVLALREIGTPFRRVFTTATVSLFLTINRSSRKSNSSS